MRRAPAPALAPHGGSERLVWRARIPTDKYHYGEGFTRPDRPAEHDRADKNPVSAMSEIVRIAQATLDMPKVINSIGLVFDILGVVLLFFTVGTPWSSFDRISRWSKVGLGLLVFGFLLQIVSNHTVCLKSLF